MATDQLNPALYSCDYCQKFAKLKMCTICKAVRYCSKECQTLDWPTHKSWCSKESDYQFFGKERKLYVNNVIFGAVISECRLLLDEYKKSGDIFVALPSDSPGLRKNMRILTIGEHVDKVEGWKETPEGYISGFTVGPNKCLMKFEIGKIELPRSILRMSEEQKTLLVNGKLTIIIDPDLSTLEYYEHQ